MTSEPTVAAASEQAAAAHPTRRKASFFKPEQWGTIFFFLLFFAFVTFEKGNTFLSWDNIFTAFAQNGHLAFIAVAATVTLITGQFDLSLGAVAGFGAVLTAGLTGTQGLPIWLAIVIVVLVGAVVGFVNGVLVTKVRINVFIATLGMSGVVGGLALIYANGQIIYNGIPQSLTDFGKSTIVGGLPTIVLIPGVMTLVMWFIAKRTVLGRYWYAVGSNSESSRLAGVNVDRTVILSLVVAGILAAFGGVMFTSRFGSVDPTVGPAYLLPAYAAAFLGSSILSDGRFSIIGTIVATFLVAFATSGLLQLGLNFADQIFNGVVLVSAVALNETLRRRVKKVARGT